MADRQDHGYKITKLRPVHGFAAETAGAATILGASAAGIPVSTTHVICSSIMGVGTTMGASTVKWGVARSIMIAWILTIPVSALIGYAAFQVIRIVIGSDPDKNSREEILARSRRLFYPLFTFLGNARKYRHSFFITHTGALRFFCRAAGPPVGDQDIREIAPLLLGEKGHEITFDHRDIIRVREADPLRQPAHMGVDGDPVVLSKAVVQDDIGGLPADAGNGKQVSMVVRHLPAKVRNQGLCRRNDMPCLRVVKPEAVDNGLNVGCLCTGESLRESGRRKRAVPLP